MSKNITVILPVHKLEENLLGGAISSVDSQKVKPSELLIVTSDDENLKKFLSEYDFGDLKSIVRIVENYGVSQCNSKYFTFLEYDDEISPIWIKNGEEYISSYPEVGVFLPIVFETDENGKFISFSNEGVWAKSYTEEPGLLDNNTLQRVQNFNFDGMIVNKETYEQHGGLKKNVKLTFTYEFLLRMTYQSVPVMVIPKLGYRHTNNRPGSLFDEYKTTIDVLESKFWVNKAKKEYYFTEDREITYEV
jgi:glycosyltransferase involved in cell wall biosynthesis